MSVSAKTRMAEVRLKHAGAAGLLALVLAGCSAPQMERQHVALHVAPTSSGVGWIYRSAAGVEPILSPGKTQGGSAALHASASHLMRVWHEHSPGIEYRKDAAGPYALLTFHDAGTRRLNPLKGGLLSWDIADMANEVRQTTHHLQSRSASYSLHLLARADDPRISLSQEDVAQVRLRRLADAFLEYGHDPRLLTGQVLPKGHQGAWKLAIAIRPYVYGHENQSHSLIAPQTL